MVIAPVRWSGEESVNFAPGISLKDEISSVCPRLYHDLLASLPLGKLIG